ncbi:MAG: DHCW motif cupin fold protein [Ferruginibacter sp.]
MELPVFPFQLLNWDSVSAEEHLGTTGKSTWKVIQMGNIRIRLVEYSAGYKANHWCSKGHIIYCIQGQMETELADKRVFAIKSGNGYMVGEENESHSSSSREGCVLFIVD